MTNEEKEMTREAETQEVAEYLEDVDNMAHHHLTEEFIMDMPDKLVIELLMKWATTKGYSITIRFGR